MSSVTLAGASALSALVKLAVGRPRPDAGALVEALGCAFPSGHATAATAGWLSVAIVLGRLTASWGHKVALVTLALLIAAIVGLARAYLAVHEPTDVPGGWALGGGWVAAILVTTALDKPVDRGAPPTVRRQHLERAMIERGQSCPNPAREARCAAVAG